MDARPNEGYSLEAQQDTAGFRKVELVVLPTGYAESDAPLAMLRSGGEEIEVAFVRGQSRGVVPFPVWELRFGD